VCTSLTAITVDVLNLAYSSVEGVLFNKSQTVLLQYPGGKAGGYTLPNGVTSIGDSAFYDSHNLPSVTIPNSVTSIGRWAFYSCGLTSVTGGNGVTSIGNYAFYSCDHLTSFTLGNGVTSIEEHAFASCTSLTGVYFQGNAPSLGGGTSVFDGDNKATI
jgi:hypothetical protein